MNYSAKIKNNLKKIGIVYALNAFWKAKTQKKNYEELLTYYKNIAHQKEIYYSETHVAEQLQCDLKSKRFKFNAIRKGDYRILYVGTDFEQDYGGIIQGLEKFGVVIPYKQSNGDYGQYLPREDKKSAWRQNGAQILNIVHESLKSGQIHIIIGQMWRKTMDPSALKEIKNMGIPVVNISMDDRHVFKGKKINNQWSGTSGLIGAIDLACTAAKECCLWYEVEGCPSIYLPEASDPELYYPMPGNKKYDVCFIGANYGIRKKIVQAIQKRGINIICYGKGWPNGRIDVKDIPELFAKSKILLGVGTIGHCTDFYALKMRDFDGPMSGSMYITHDNPDLYELYDVGKEIVTYKTPEECAEKIDYYLRHDEEREKIAKAGRLRAEKNHTWEQRFEKIFRTLGII